MKELIAHVGAFRPISPGDFERIVEVAQAVPDWPVTAAHDIINIEQDGRDFLTETRQYDAVVLHSIFHHHTMNPVHNVLRRQQGHEICSQISVAHSIENWRTRLETCGARLIVVCETLPSSLSGWQLGELKGYKILRRDHRLTVYEKLR